MDTEAERMRILEMIEAGSITAEQALLLLQSLNGDVDEDAAPEDDLDPRRDVEEAGWQVHPLEAPAMDIAPPVLPDQEDGWSAIELPDPYGGAAQSMPDDLPAEAARWKRFWTVPLWIGVGITVLGGLLMYLSLGPSGAVSGWFVCASLPFALGVLVLALAWASRRAPWLHLRIQQAPGQNPQRIALSFPLPLGLAAWFLRTFRNVIPHMPGEDMDQVIMAVGRTATAKNPIYIQVDEGDNGEKVEIFIG